MNQSARMCGRSLAAMRYTSLANWAKFASGELVVLQAVGIDLQDFLPQVVLVPAHVAQVDGEDRLLRIDGLGHDDRRLEGQAVDQLREGGPVQPHLVVGHLLVIVEQVGEREVPQERPIRGLGLRQVGVNGRDHLLLALERAGFAAGERRPSRIHRLSSSFSASDGLSGASSGGMSPSTPTRVQR